MLCRITSCWLLVGHAAALLLHEQKSTEVTNVSNSWTVAVEAGGNEYGGNAAWVRVCRPPSAMCIGLSWINRRQILVDKLGNCAYAGERYVNMQVPVDFPAAGNKATMVGTFYTNQTLKFSLLWDSPQDGQAHIFHVWTQLSIDVFRGNPEEMTLSSRFGNEGNGDCCGCPVLEIGEEVTTRWQSNRVRFDYKRLPGFPGAHDGEQDPSATGDPHCQNVMGEEFEIRQRGLLDFIRVPKAADVVGAKLLVQAEIDGPLEEKCFVTFIKSFSVNGTGVEQIQVVATESGPVLVRGTESKALSHTDDTADSAGLMKTNLGNMVFARKQKDHRWSELSIPRWNLTFRMETRMYKNLYYFDLHTHGLKQLGDDVGGILGYDSHWHAQHDAPEHCNHKVGKAHHMEGSTVRVN